MINKMTSRMTKLRDEKGLSAFELNAKLGWPKGTFDKFESGRVTPSKEQVKKIAAFFGVTEAYLRGESDDAGSSTNWLSGNIMEEEPIHEFRPAPAPKKALSVQNAAKEKEDGAVFNLLLKSDAFRQSVLEVLRSPEGQKLIQEALRKSQYKL